MQLFSLGEWQPCIANQVYQLVMYCMYVCMYVWLCIFLTLY